MSEDHLRLLRHAHVSWFDGEYGAPSVDPKRPYCWSNVEGSMAQVLDWPDRDWIDEEPPGVEDRYARLHAETAIALQIVLATGEFRPGRYTPSEGWAVTGHGRRTDQVTLGPRTAPACQPDTATRPGYGWLDRSRLQ
jgi:hypothetical protein